MFSLSLYKNWNSKNKQEWHEIRSRGYRDFLIKRGFLRFGTFFFLSSNFLFYIQYLVGNRPLDEFWKVSLTMFITTLIIGPIIAKSIWQDTEQSLLENENRD